MESFFVLRAGGDWVFPPPPRPMWFLSIALMGVKCDTLGFCGFFEQHFLSCVMVTLSLVLYLFLWGSFLYTGPRLDQMVPCGGPHLCIQPGKAFH